MIKPDRIFDRDFEWRHLAAFAARDGGQPRLGVVSGRRRQGKTFLAEALARETGGMYFGATQATEAESLHLFTEALADYLEAPVPPRFVSWDEAVTYLFSVAGTRPGPVVIDEFPYLSAVSPALPSILQREIDRAVARANSICLLLCGSAMSVMGKILAGNAPLRARASLELVVRPFDYPLAARFWNIDDPGLAVRHHAVVGGTPAYRRFVNGDSPENPDDFNDWVLRTVLNPATPLFREARYLLEEEADVRDTALYHSVLAAVAGGNNTRGGIAGYIGRKAADIGHHLNVLEDCGLLRREPDLFRQSRSVYRIAEPLIVFYQVVMRPRWGLLESGRAANVWLDARPRFSAQVVGPHFEQICREFAVAAPSDTFGGLPAEVGAGVVADPARKSQIEVDVAVLAPAEPGEPRRVLSLGEAKWGEVMGIRHVERLRRARDLLAGKGFDTRETVIACYSGAGFDHDLQTSANGDRVLTVGLPELYGWNA
ncbi:AAA family ATPase [Protofrankia symbiont of Coriaria ruscifolia]|uniref:AAA family ATPase n=1 Tax=Protofrankia symbiont of Coriaria ruscifolia TaxID=1306542 RepID=UPI0010412A16|nr:ATP-binding protein [Protofrankia symbiont of Coriaria ruscifolia]